MYPLIVNIFDLPSSSPSLTHHFHLLLFSKPFSTPPGTQTLALAALNYHVLFFLNRVNMDAAMARLNLFVFACWLLRRPALLILIGVCHLPHHFSVPFSFSFFASSYLFFSLNLFVALLVFISFILLPHLIIYHKLCHLACVVHALATEPKPTHLTLPSYRLFTQVFTTMLRVNYLPVLGVMLLQLLSDPSDTHHGRSLAFKGMTRCYSSTLLCLSLFPSLFGSCNYIINYM